ncbi:MAG: hypothetical protein J2P55_16850, partial [Rhizobiales bacterium]|nr:hypothetical protein [Hyphomicrobiales bacterium]
MPKSPVRPWQPDSNKFASGKPGAVHDPQVVASYKSLSQVEQAVRSIKTVDLEIRPIYHWLEDRVRAHVLLCMLAYHVEWHMRGALAPMLYE